MFWQRTIHSGWRRVLGVVVLVMGLGGAAFYYIELALVQKQLQDRTKIVTAPSPKIVAQTTELATPTPIAAEVALPPHASGKVKLSTATQAELEALPRIGPKTA